MNIASGAGFGMVFKGDPIGNGPGTCPERPGAKRRPREPDPLATTVGPTVTRWPQNLNHPDVALLREPPTGCKTLQKFSAARKPTSRRVPLPLRGWSWSKRNLAANREAAKASSLLMRMSRIATVSGPGWPHQQDDHTGSSGGSDAPSVFCGFRTSASKR